MIDENFRLITPHEYFDNITTDKCIINKTSVNNHTCFMSNNCRNANLDK